MYMVWCCFVSCAKSIKFPHLPNDVPEAGGVRQDSVYDVDVKVVLLPNLLDVDIFMALFLDLSTCATEFKQFL